MFAGVLATNLNASYQKRHMISQTTKVWGIIKIEKSWIKKPKIIKGKVINLNGLSYETSKNLVHASVKSNLKLCDVIWHWCEKLLLRKLGNLQNLFFKCNKRKICYSF